MLSFEMKIIDNSIEEIGILFIYFYNVSKFFIVKLLLVCNAIYRILIKCCS